MCLQVAPGGHLTLADAEEQKALTVERNPRAVVTSPSRVGHEQLFYIVELIVFETGSHDRGRRPVLVRVGLRIAHIDQLVRAEVGVQYDVQEPTLPRRVDLGDTGDRSRKQFPVPNDPQSSGALGHEDVAVGQKRHRPRIHQPVRNRDDPVVVIRRAPELAGVLGRDIACDGHGQSGGGKGHQCGAGHLNVSCALRRRKIGFVARSSMPRKK